MKKTVIFYILVIFFLALIFFQGKAPDTVVSPKYNKMNVILETKVNEPTDILLKVNDYFYDVPKSKNVLNKTLKDPVKTLDILIKEDFKNEIKGIVFFNELKTNYYQDFSKFQKSTISLCPKGACSNYTKYRVPNEVKLNPALDSYNFRSILNGFCFFVLSIFTMAPVALLFVFLIFYFVSNKNEIKHPFKNSYVIFGVIFAVAVLLRYNGLFDYLPWMDEYYAVEFSSPERSLLVAFVDPGNPPAFYILFKIWLSILGISNFSIKSFPFVISILTLFSIWWFLKKEFNIKAANTGLLIAAFNIPLIYYSSECRSYILQALMSPFLIYFLFKILKEGKNRDFIIYGVLVAFVSNIHYYEILLVVSNFLYGGFFLLKEKRKNDFVKFFTANFTGGLFFLPFFFLTSLNGAALDSSFNSWLPDSNFEQIKKCVFYLFGGGVSLFISLVLFKFIKTEKAKKMAAYLLFTIFFIFLQAILISASRSIMYQRYFVLLIPYLIIYLGIAFSEIKTKYAPCIFAILLLFIQNNTFEKNNHKKGLIDIPLVMSNQYKTDKQIYVITNLTSMKFLKEHEKYMKKDIVYMSDEKDKAKEMVESIGKNSVVFTTNLETTMENFKTPDNYTCFFNSSADICVWKIEK